MRGNRYWLALNFIVVCWFVIRLARGGNKKYLPPVFQESMVVHNDSIKVVIAETASELLVESDSRIRDGQLQNFSVKYRDNSVVGDDSWQPSDEWIHDCVRRQADDSVNQPFEVQWENYRLGDCIRACNACSNSMKASTYGNLSIAGEYWINVCHEEDQNGTRSKNFDYLYGLFQRYKHDPYPYSDPWKVPSPDDLVVHLRIGDVMDESSHMDGNITPFVMLRDGAATSHGPMDRYPHGIKSISMYLSLLRDLGQRNVFLRGGAHSPKPYPKSKIYTRCLIMALEAAGFSTEGSDLEGRHNPDQDFYYMSHARQFVPGTGGYSMIIAKMVNRLGGKVINRIGEKTTNVLVG